MMTEEERKAKNNARSKAWREANPERARDGVRQWTKDNHERKKKADRDYQKDNREEISAKQKVRRTNNPETQAYQKEYNQQPEVKARRRDRQLRKMYGITLVEYNELFLNQGSRCAICLDVKSGNMGRVFHVDHDHVTGKVRGLLCHGCNTALGLLKEDPELIRKVADYIEKSRKDSK